MAQYYNPNLVALLGGGDWWDNSEYPSRLMDQKFGVGLYDDDLRPPIHYRGYNVRPRTQQCYDASGQSEVNIDSNKFEVNLDVEQFGPENISVKVVDNFVIVHAKHEEKEDEHGFIAREFTRKYSLPEGVQLEKLESSYTDNGILKIIAPIKSKNSVPKERKVPIILERIDDD